MKFEPDYQNILQVLNNQPNGVKFFLMMAEVK